MLENTWLLDICFGSTPNVEAKISHTEIVKFGMYVTCKNDIFHNLFRVGAE